MLSLLPPDTELQRDYRLKTKDLCNGLRSTAVNDDASSRYRSDVFKGLGQAGLLASYAPKEFGGSQLPFSVHYTVLEEISRASLSMTVVVGVNNLVQGAILAFGTDSQKKHYLPLLVRGEWLGAFSLSESGSGSDAAALSTSARRVDGGYRITGSKMWCSNAGHADLYLVMARTGESGPKGISAFLLEKGTPGLRFGKLENKMGLRGSTLAELLLEDCWVKDSARLGLEGEGFKVALSQLDVGRITIGTGGLGTAIEALSIYWARRLQGPSQFEQGDRDIFAGHFAEIQALKLMVDQAALLRESGARLSIIAAQVKLLGSDLAVRVSGDVISGLGWDGYVVGGSIERLLRDAKALQIVEGTNQIQRLVLSRELDRMY